MFVPKTDFVPMTPKKWEATSTDKKNDAAGEKRYHQPPSKYENSNIDGAQDAMGVAKTNADRSKAKWPVLPGLDGKPRRQ